MRGSHHNGKSLDWIQFTLKFHKLFISSVRCIRLLLIGDLTWLEADFGKKLPSLQFSFFFCVTASTTIACLNTRTENYANQEFLNNESETHELHIV